MITFLVPRSLRRAYAHLAAERSAASFPARALSALNIALDLSDTALARVPSSGPLVVVANHPFGAADGLALLALLERVRGDVRIIGNDVLAAVPEMAERCIHVDPDRRRRSLGANATAVRQALRWLKGGGCVAIFPAGEVAHQVARDAARVIAIDAPWRETPIWLAASSGAALLPVFFHGANSRAFRALGRIHPRLRTAMLASELARRRGARMRVTIGEPIESAELARLEDVSARLAYVRTRTYLLAAGAADAERPVPEAAVPVAEPGAIDVVRAEIDALGPGHLLVASGDHRVLYAAASEIPATLSEIGRLRELTFRAAGEGSGLVRDLDRFDAHYRHLFVWDLRAARIVGAYRVGATDEIVQRFGLEGLYTRTLFRYDRSLLERMGPALELGRAFVRPECQRDFSSLLLLWKGIGQIVAREPRYRRLFGTVSISNRYDSISRALLVRFLRATRYQDDLGCLVTPRIPHRPAPRDAVLDGAVIASLEAVSRLLALIERDGKGIPVLLRQYLKLNAKVLGFNVDPSFGDVLDGLMMVDLADVEPSILARYMGKEEAARFRLSLKQDAAGASTGASPPRERAA